MTGEEIAAPPAYARRPGAASRLTIALVIAILPGVGSVGVAQPLSNASDRRTTDRRTTDGDHVPTVDERTRPRRPQDPEVARGMAPELPPDEDVVAPPQPEGEDVVESLGAAMGGTLGAPANPRARVHWDPSWPRYRFDELVLTLGMGLVIGLEEALPTRTDANWRGVTELDLAVAQTLGLRSMRARDTVEELSDGIAAALFVWPVLFDSLLYAGLGEGAWDVAWQLSLMSLEVFAINHALTVLVRLLTRRERPVGRFCREEAGYDADPICVNQPPAESFWSAHTSNAFAGAALVCMHHDMLDLFGDEVADGLTCGAALAAAAATGLFRVMSDYQWVTDVITGAVVGSLSGILIPWLLHYQGGARPPLTGTDAPPFALMPMLGDGTVGMSGFGLW